MYCDPKLQGALGTISPCLSCPALQTFKSTISPSIRLTSRHLPFIYYNQIWPPNETTLLQAVYLIYSKPQSHVDGPGRICSLGAVEGCILTWTLILELTVEFDSFWRIQINVQKMSMGHSTVYMYMWLRNEHISFCCIQVKMQEVKWFSKICIEWALAWVTLLYICICWNVHRSFCCMFQWIRMTLSHSTQTGGHVYHLWLEVRWWCRNRQIAAIYLHESSLWLGACRGKRISAARAMSFSVVFQRL